VGELLGSQNLIALDASNPGAFTLVREVKVKQETLGLGSRGSDLLFQNAINVLFLDRAAFH